MPTLKLDASGVLLEEAAALCRQLRLMTWGSGSLKGGAEGRISKRPEPLQVRALNQVSGAAHVDSKWTLLQRSAPRELPAARVSRWGQTVGAIQILGGWVERSSMLEG